MRETPESASHLLAELHETILLQSVRLIEERRIQDVAIHSEHDHNIHPVLDFDC